MACYYGCLLTRPPDVTGEEHYEYPTNMDRLVETLGAEAVDWSYKTDCCGGSLSLSTLEIALDLSHKILKNARDLGADLIVTACPLCHANLDMRQKQINDEFGEEFNIPILYFTQLMGVAYGLSPKELGLDKHFTDAIGLLKEKGVLAPEHPHSKDAGGVSPPSNLTRRRYSMALTENPVTAFLDELASNAPAPGGGSVAALSGRTGRSAGQHGCQPDRGQEGLRGGAGRHPAPSGPVGGAAPPNARTCSKRTWPPTPPYSQAAKMPRDTDEQKAARSDAMQTALKNATMPCPCRSPRPRWRSSTCAAEPPKRATVRAVSDAGVAVLMAEAALRSAALNVLINLGSIKDQDFVDREARPSRRPAGRQGRDARRDL